jgi:hypothetical protein
VIDVRRQSPERVVAGLVGRDRPRGLVLGIHDHDARSHNRFAGLVDDGTVNVLGLFLVDAALAAYVELDLSACGRRDEQNGHECDGEVFQAHFLLKSFWMTFSVSS